MPSMEIGGFCWVGEGGAFDLWLLAAERDLPSWRRQNPGSPFCWGAFNGGPKGRVTKSLGKSNVNAGYVHGIQLLAVKCRAEFAPWHLGQSTGQLTSA